MPDPNKRPLRNAVDPQTNNLALYILPAPRYSQSHDQHMLMDDGDHASDLDHMSNFDPDQYLEDQDGDHPSDGELEYLDEEEYLLRELSTVEYQAMAAASHRD